MRVLVVVCVIAFVLTIDMIVNAAVVEVEVMVVVVVVLVVEDVVVVVTVQECGLAQVSTLTRRFSPLL